MREKLIAKNDTCNKYVDAPRINDRFNPKDLIILGAKKTAHKKRAIKKNPKKTNTCKENVPVYKQFFHW